MHIQDAQLKRFMLDSGMALRKDLDAAETLAEDRSMSFAEALISNGTITEDDLRRIEAYILGVPFVQLSGTDLTFDVLSIIPEPIARGHNVIAFKKEGNVLEVATLDVQNMKALETLAKRMGYRMRPRLTDTASMKYALGQYHQGLKTAFGSRIAQEARGVAECPQTADGKIDISALAKRIERPEVVRIVDMLLRHAIAQSASDVHIEPAENELVIRYRIDGVLHDAMVLPKRLAPFISARIKNIAGLRLDQKYLPQEGRFKMELESQKIVFRVSVVPVYFGEKVVMRLVEENRSGFTLEGIGFHGESLEQIHEVMRERQGLIVLAGPEDSGKTTTLYTMLDVLNTPDVNVATIEDPIEYQLARVNQTQIRPDLGLTFASGLRALLRQDSDIVMVGDIKDAQTATLTTHAAQSGHLMLGGMYAARAVDVITRLREMDIEPFVLAHTLKLAIGIRLVGKLPEEKEAYTLSKEERDALEQYIDMNAVLKHLKAEGVVKKTATWSTIPFYRPKKDAVVEGLGRIGIHEVLRITPALRELILEEADIEKIQKHAAKEGMTTLAEDGLFKAALGQTSIEEVLRILAEE
ncbi:GspE/PulE family protein [Candidatus Kaiserbacteria bacterium]|nr:GspE/PulE family protein [Candidatus Kaiserbacteria bacterium]